MRAEVEMGAPGYAAKQVSIQVRSRAASSARVPALVTP